MNIRDAKDKTVGEVLKNYYKIPRFQRPYSWGKEEIELFYEDIFNSDENYFIGHMVTYQISDDIKGVIDGQQRLTTITLILCAIRNQFIDLGENTLVDGIQNYIQSKNRDGVLQNSLISESSSPFIKQAFQDTPKEVNVAFEINAATEEEKALKAAFKQINNKISEDLITRKRIDYKKKFLKKLRDNLLQAVLIYVELDNEDDAYTIFQTLNSTGKDLDLIDLVKSQLLKLLKASDSTYDGYKNKWHEMISKLNKNKIYADTFFQHFWVSRNGLITKSKIFKEFKKSVKKRTTAAEMLPEIVKNSEMYAFLVNPFSNNFLIDPDVKESLGALRTFKVSQSHSFVLSMLRCHSNKTLSLKNMKACLKRIERFHFLYTAITSGRASGISNKYAAYAKNLFNQTNTDKDKIVREFNFKDKFPSFEEFNENFEKILLYNKDKTDKKIVQYILTVVDNLLNEHAGRSVDYKSMTVEHIVSQSQSRYGKHIGMLGNLILVDGGIQNKLGTKPLNSKIDLLHKNGFDSNKFFLTKKTSKQSTKDWIEERTKNISTLIYEEYTKSNRGQSPIK